jgi:hypothetical protein
MGAIAGSILRSMVLPSLTAQSRQPARAATSSPTA